MIVALAACGLLPDDATPTPIVVPDAVVLPGANDALPDRAEGSTAWTADFPSAYDREGNHTGPEGVVDAFVAALGGAATNRDVETYREITGRVVVLVTHGGAGDDSIFGSQYALVIEPRGGGWHLAQLYVRTLCRRGVDAGSDLCV